MNIPRNSTMKGSVNRNPASPWRFPAFCLRPPGARAALGGAVTVTSVMSCHVMREVGRGGPPRRAPPRRLLALDRQALLLGVADDGILPRLQRRRGAGPRVDGLALDRIALGVDVL